MAAPGNPWVGYTDRSYDQIRANLLAKFPAYVPEVTDQTENNPFVTMVNVWAGVAEMLGFYVDRRAREAFLATAQRFESAVKFARLVDYRVRGALPASVDITFSFANPSPTDVTIPQGTEVQTPQGVRFFTVASAQILTGQTQVTVSALQLIPVSLTSLGISNGQPGQTFSIPLTPGQQVANGNILVEVNSLLWLRQDTLAYSAPADEHFVAGLNEDGLMEIAFGDGISGAIPGGGFDISASWNLTLGALGNVGPGTVTNIASAVIVPPGFTLLANNLTAASGGADEETLEDLRRRIPLFTRTNDRAVTRRDYIDTALLVPGVAKADIVFECGKTVDLYVAPQGGGQATQQLLQDVVSYFEPRRMVTTRVRAFSAGQVEIVQDWFIQVLPNFGRIDTETAVRNALINYLSVDNQNIGASVEPGNLYEVVEAVQGVDFSRLNSYWVKPFARILSGTNPLNWQPIVGPGSLTTVRWEILFTAPTQFNLTRDNSFIGSFNTGILISQLELEITVIGTYAVGDQWEFYTYPYSQPIDLTEPSVPVAFTGNITITISGGL
jgi:uncharacterized phage protein gp47/JayE